MEEVWKCRPPGWKIHPVMKPARVSWLVPCARVGAQTAGTIIPENKKPPLKKMSFGALAGIAPSAIASAAPAQDVAAGKTSFNKCMGSHSVGEGPKKKGS